MNRLPWGRTYMRNGSVIDLQIKKGEVLASVSGSARGARAAGRAGAAG
jgi:uncharacterized Zn finger protein